MKNVVVQVLETLIFIFFFYFLQFPLFSLKFIKEFPNLFINFYTIIY